jgi:hypothetical protein
MTARPNQDRTRWQTFWVYLDFRDCRYRHQCKRDPAKVIDRKWYVRTIVDSGPGSPETISARQAISDETGLALWELRREWWRTKATYPTMYPPAFAGGFPEREVSVAE